MKKIALFLLTAATITACQKEVLEMSKFDNEAILADASGKVSNEEIFNTVEVNPEFPGGIQEMYKFIGENLVYPQEAQKNNISGKVFVKFVVKKDGSIGEIKTLKGLGYGCEEEVQRIIREMPRWLPGQQNGHNVNAYYTMPIAFKIE